MDTRLPIKRPSTSNRPLHPKILEGFRTNLQTQQNDLRNKSRKPKQCKSRSKNRTTRQPTPTRQQSKNPPNQRRHHPPSKNRLRMIVGKIVTNHLPLTVTKAKIIVPLPIWEGEYAGVDYRR